MQVGPAYLRMKYISLIPGSVLYRAGGHWLQKPWIELLLLNILFRRTPALSLQHSNNKSFATLTAHNSKDLQTKKKLKFKVELESSCHYLAALHFRVNNLKFTYVCFIKTLEVA